MEEEWEVRQSNGSNVTWALRSRAPTLSEVRSQREGGFWAEWHDLTCFNRFLLATVQRIDLRRGKGGSRRPAERLLLLIQSRWENMVARSRWQATGWWKEIKAWLCFEGEGDRFPHRPDVGGREKEKARVLAWATRRMELLLTEAGKTSEWVGFVERIRRLVFDMGRLRCLLNMQMGS